MMRFLTLARILLVALLTFPVNAYCQDVQCVEVRDTLGNFVVSRRYDGSSAYIYKINCFQSKQQILSSYELLEENNKAAIHQCCINYSKEKMEHLINNSCFISNDKKAGRVFLSLILSKTLNIEYFEFHGQGLNNLSSEDLFNIYKAISQSNLFSIWNYDTPYVSFVTSFVI